MIKMLFYDSIIVSIYGVFLEQSPDRVSNLTALITKTKSKSEQPHVRRIILGRPSGRGH